MVQRHTDSLGAQWVNHQGCDAETLVEITREMHGVFMGECGDMEDSRCFGELCVDMARDFQELHKHANWDERDFPTEIARYASRVRQKLASYPDWINIDYRWMSGSETVKDLLRKT